MRPGIYLTHKPVGVTSHSIVRTWMEEVAGEARPPPLCHGGTLDPFAEGLLLILVGQATRLMDLIHAVPKTYVAEVTWGRETDNGDLLGQTVFEGDPSQLTAAQLDAALGPFLGWHDQVPPATSAKKIGGEPAYKKAHRGEDVVLPPSRVFLQEARWLSHELPNKSRLLLSCRGGFYVRSLVRELGRALGCGAHVSALLRTEIGPWKVPDPSKRVLICGDQLLPWCPSRMLTDAEATATKLGGHIPIGELQPPTWHVPSGFPDPQGPVRALYRGDLWALLHEQEGSLHPSATFPRGI